MAGRQNKVGLDYFELDCHMDEKVRLIQAEYGLKGFAVFVKLLQEIYGGHGYYCEWTQDRELLFASENGLNGGSLQLLRDIVSACIRRNIFSERLYEEYGVLASAGIQKQYLKATVKREVVELKKEYLLIFIPENRTNVVINSISDGINSISDGINTQSRVEKSREDNISCAIPEESHESFFERIWKLYPVKKGKGQVSKTKKQVLQRIGYEELERCVKRFVQTMEKEKRDKQYWMHGSTFFNSGYVDYLDKNWTDTEQSITANKPVAKNMFNDFEQRDYDFDDLEKRLLAKK